MGSDEIDRSVRLRAKVQISAVFATIGFMVLLGNGNAVWAEASAQGGELAQAQLATGKSMPEAGASNLSTSDRSESLRVVGNSLYSSGAPFRLVGLDVTGTEDRCLGKATAWLFLGSHKSR